MSTSKRPTGWGPLGEAVAGPILRLENPDGIYEDLTMEDLLAASGEVHW